MGLPLGGGGYSCRYNAHQVPILSFDVYLGAQLELALYLFKHPYFFRWFAWKQAIIMSFLSR